MTICFSFTDNWALLYAQRMALKQEVPLIVCFCLPSKYLDAAFRQYSFMITGLQEVEKVFTSLNTERTYKRSAALEVQPKTRHLR